MAIDYTRTYFGWSSESPSDWANPTSGLVIHYNGPATGLDDHAECVSYWKATRNGHVSGNGWADLGYSFGVSVDGDVFEGRGVDHYQAAQGTTAGNRDYYSVSLMIGGSEQPTPKQINGVRRLRAWLMAEHGMAGTVLGHRDFVSTSCPGSPLYALVQDGTFTQPPGAHTEEDMSGIIGLRIGDEGEEVKAVQYLVRAAGNPVDVDGDFGEITAEAVRQTREDIGSAALEGWGDVITGAAAVQLQRAVAKKEAEKLIAGLDLSGGTGGGSLPATATISGTVNLEA